MNKLLIVFEIVFSAFITNVAYCAKMPTTGIPDQQEKSTKTSKQNTNTKTTQNNKKDKNQKNKQNQANIIELSQNILDGATVAATGIGGMELTQGFTEQQADKDAETDLTAYTETMYCTYGNDKQIKAGPEKIELPGAQNEEIAKLRAEYFALAASLKERKKELGMEPGIESEEIIDKAQTGLYDDEFVGITSGAYESVYRAKMLDSTTDKTQIEDSKKATQNKITGGAVSLGVGIVGGTITNKINETLNTSETNKKETKQNKKDSTANTTKANTQKSKQQTKQKEKK